MSKIRHLSDWPARVKIDVYDPIDMGSSAAGRETGLEPYLDLKTEIDELRESTSLRIAELEKRMDDSTSYKPAHRQRLDAGVVAGGIVLGAVLIGAGILRQDLVFGGLGLLTLIGNLVHAMRQ